MGSDFGRCYVQVDVRALEPKTRAKELRARRELSNMTEHNVKFHLKNIFSVTIALRD
jgi:hypothetical protein